MNIDYFTGVAPNAEQNISGLSACQSEPVSTQNLYFSAIQNTAGIVFISLPLIIGQIEPLSTSHVILGPLDYQNKTPDQMYTKYVEYASQSDQDPIPLDNFQDLLSGYAEVIHSADNQPSVVHDYKVSIYIEGKPFDIVEKHTGLHPSSGCKILTYETRYI